MARRWRTPFVSTERFVLDYLRNIAEECNILTDNVEPMDHEEEHEVWGLRVCATDEENKVICWLFDRLILNMRRP